MKIEKLKYDEIPEASTLIKKVFNEFTAENYSKSGIVHFYNVIDERSIKERFLNNSRIDVVKIENKIIAYIEIINENHIFLLFVEKKFQKQGIAGKLIFSYLNELTEKNPEIRKITVNSTVNAVNFYERFGFAKIADFQLKNEILSFPMCYSIRDE